MTDPMLSPLLKRIMSRRTKGIKGDTIRWSGSKAPRGVKWGSTTLGWAQHGVLYDQKGEDVGTYHRVIEFGGKDGDIQEILAWPR